jgi:hypothetical protein
MVTPRRPDETDADYVARLAAGEERRNRAFEAADHATFNFSMVAELGRQGGFDLPGVDGWQRRAAFLHGIDVAMELSIAALDGRTVRDLPPDLKSAFDLFIVFRLNDYDTLAPIPQADIDAVTVAAETVAEHLKAAIETLRSTSRGS